MVGMGIAQELDQTIDAYRNNPAGLQKAQQLDPSTIKLLALERINREMKAKTNDINMSLNNNPQTIAAKKEGEVLNGVMGVLANNKAKKDANMNKVASTGVADIPAPNMQQMAGGGIVGFAGQGESLVGGDIAERIEALRAKLATGDLEDVEIAAIEKTIESLELQMGEQNLGVVSTADDTENGEYEDLNLVGQGNVPDNEKKDNAGIKSIMDQFSVDPAQFKLTPGNLNLPTAAPKQLTSKDYQIDQTKNPFMKDLADTAKKDANIDTLAVQDKALEKGQEYMGYTPEEKKRQIERENARKQLYKDQTGTEYEQRKQGLIQSLINARGTDSGTALAAGARAGQTFDAKQDSLQRSMLEKVLGEEEEFDDKNQQIRVKTYDASIKALEIASKEKTSGKRLLGDIALNYDKNVSENATRLLETDKSNIKSINAQRAIEMSAVVANVNNGVKVAVANLEGALTEQKNLITKSYNDAMVNVTDRKAAQDSYVRIKDFLNDSKVKYEKLFTDKLKVFSMMAPKDRKELFGTEDLEKIKIKLQKEQKQAFTTSTLSVQDMLNNLEKRLNVPQSKASKTPVNYKDYLKMNT